MSLPRTSVAEAILFPVGILLVKALLRLLVDREANVKELLDVIIALPVDVLFIATSLFAGTAVLNKTQIGDTFGVFLLYIAAGIVAAFGTRRSSRKFAQDKWIGVVGFSALSWAVSAVPFAYSVVLLHRGAMA